MMEMIKMLAVILFSLSMVPSISSATSCFTTNCHRAIAELKNLHQPVKEEDCLACHVRRANIHPILVGEAKTFQLTAEGAKLCDKCHDTLGMKKNVHSPVRKGNCLACHKAHGASGRFLLDVDEDQTALCVRCHDKGKFSLKFIHGPVAIGTCTQCHDPHESPNPSLLTKQSRDLCLSCHADFATAMSKASVSHPPVLDKPCTSCHNPHSSATRQLLKKPLPDLCFTCHDAIEKKVADAKVQHKTLQQNDSCNNCHLPHYGSVKKLLASDEQTVCLGCHGKDKFGQPPLRNIKTEIEKKKYLHGPVQTGSCSQCHDPHGSDVSSILKGPYPESFYSLYQEKSYDFCLGCHNKDLLRFPETSLYTGFRNGKRNLHFVHVADKRKGRTCRACHEPHGASLEKLISQDGPQFGEWKIPIRFEKSPTGGSCAPGCHRTFKYDRDKPENYDEIKP